MSVLGIDVGTTGCKVASFSDEGKLLAAAYREHAIDNRRAGWAELDPDAVWTETKRAIREVAARTMKDPIRALSISSLGEAVVPVSKDRQVLAPSILNFDIRGQAYVDELQREMADGHLYQLNGNTWGNHYGLTKLLWIRDHKPRLYEQTDRFLLWSSFVSSMLGADPVVDYTLANRMLLFDLAVGDWSDELLSLTGIDREKLPDTAPSGTPIGTVPKALAEELGLHDGVVVTTGAHDQCANAVGCGVIEPRRAVYGMGTFLCITPVFTERPAADAMVSRGLNTEHHAVPDAFVSFIYNQGGSLVKWYRDTFALAEHQAAQDSGNDVYSQLFAEMPDGPGRLVALPHFTTTGPPDFIADSAGVIAGLRLETSRGAILKALIEGATFYLREAVDGLEGTGITIDDYRAVGGGSKSEAWVQLSADILGRPLARPVTTEAGALGAAIIAGVGSGLYDDYPSAVGRMVSLEQRFEPDAVRHRQYTERFGHYRRLRPLMEGYLRSLVAP